MIVGVLRPLLEGSRHEVARHDFGRSPRLAGVAQGLLRCVTVSRSLLELQVRVHRRGAEDTEAAQRP
jgi:hypothetical protein